MEIHPESKQKVKIEISTNIEYDEDYRKIVAINGLLVDGKIVLIREISPWDLISNWNKFQEVKDGKSTIVDEFKSLVLFIDSLMPLVTSTNIDALKRMGFSIWRLLWSAFLKVNEDFLWISDSLGITTIVGILREEARSEGLELIHLIISALKKDVNKLKESLRTNDEKSQGKTEQKSLPQ